VSRFSRFRTAAPASRAFTLVELLVVVAIIVTLIALLLLYRRIRRRLTTAMLIRDALTSLGQSDLDESAAVLDVQLGEEARIWNSLLAQISELRSAAIGQRAESLLHQDSRERVREIEIFIPPGPRLGDVVIRADDLTKAFGDRLLFENVNFDLPPGGIIGIIGPNGAGKTTLFRMITGEQDADGGEIKIGETVKLAYVEQSRDALEAGQTVWEAISGGQDEMKIGQASVNSRTYAARFGFTGSDQQKRVDVLSGGERNRLHLAKMLCFGANVILLDEPTNDLDVNTLRALEEALETFAGCAVVISHDRWFLDRVATHILAFEGDSQVVWFEGNYQAYEEARHKRLGIKADRPHRIKYRRLAG